MKQFLLHLDETKELGRPFVIQDLDETHLFINADVLETLQESIDDLMDRLHFPVAAQIGNNWSPTTVIKPLELLCSSSYTWRLFRLKDWKWQQYVYILQHCWDF